MAGAGHPPLLVSRADGTWKNSALAVSAARVAGDLDPPRAPLQLGPGDGFLLFTDGFYDVVDGGGARMEIPAFEQCVREIPALAARRPRKPGTAGAVLAELLKCLHAYSEGQPFADDLAALTIFRTADA